MRSALTLAVVVLALVCAAPAAAQSDISIGLYGGDGVVRAADVEATGALTVAFHGDRAAGCENFGNCDVAGVVEWSPASSGYLVASRARGSRHVQSELDLGDYQDAAFGTVASVQRAGGAICTDATGGLSGSGATGDSSDGRIRLALSPEVVDTRCPGPLGTDLQAALGPGPSLAWKALKPGARLDFGGGGPFSADGLAGTVTSTVAVRVARRQPTGESSVLTDVTTPRSPRIRFVSVDYAINDVEGSAALDFTGLTDPAACLPLDSCGVTGRALLAPSAAWGRLSLIAMTRARRPRRDALAALGLSRRGNARGVPVMAVGSWQGSGTVTTEAARPGGPTCHDSAAVTTGMVDGARRGRGLRLRYELTPDAGSARTRCNGPLLPTSDSLAPVARGDVSFAALRRPLTAVRLEVGRSLTDDGYSIVTHPHIAIGLQRGHVHESTAPG